MKYQDYQLQEFLQDPLFIRWVKEKDPEINYFWEQYLVRNPEKREIVQIARRIVSSINYAHHLQFPEEKRHQILENLIDLNRKRHTVQRNINYSLWFRNAAAILLILVASFLIVGKMHNGEKNFISDVASNYIVKQVPYGQKLTIRLPDHSMVTLNAGSSIKYEKNFINGRKVDLSGEAFFDVSRDTLHPFIIHSHQLEVTVLGTSFNINAYPEDQKVEVAVVTGKVMVNSDADSAILLPNHLATYHKNDNTINNIEKDISEQVAWKNGILIFNRSNIRELERKLEQWFGVDVEFQGSVADYGFYSGKYVNESLESVLEGISYASGLRYTLEDNLVTLKKSMPM